jgi:DNA-binding transcriptional regulator YiaG
MLVMAKRKSAAGGEPAGAANPWPARLRAVQDRLRLTNAEVAARLGIPQRTWVSWKYGERRPNAVSASMIDMLERGKI